MRFKHYLHYYLFTILLCSLYACGGGEKQETSSTTNTSENTTSQEQTSNTSEQSTSSSTYKAKGEITLINSDNGTQYASIDLRSDQEVIIKYGSSGEVLDGHQKNAEKIEYFNNKGDIITQVKHKEGGFKLKDTEGKLQWKVKIKEGKIKIMDNEEGNDPFEIKKNSTGKYKVKNSEKVLGEAKWKEGKITVKGSSIYLINAGSNHPAFTVLELKEIPDHFRLIIIAELFKYI